MNWLALKRHFRLFDERGLPEDTIVVLRLMIASVAFGVVWTNVTTGVALPGFLKALGASDSLYGLVFALPALANAFQFLCSYLLERTHRPRRMMLIAGLTQRLVWIPIALIPFALPASAGALKLTAAVVMALISASMAPFMNVAFYTIASAVPIRIRGRYFATRSRVSTLVGLVIGLLIGVILDAMPGMTGYAAVFALAGVFGVLDILCYLRMRELPMATNPDKQGLFSMLWSVLKDKNYMRTVLILTAWLFCVQLTSPYHNVYLRTVLGISNFNIILTGQIAGNLALILLVTRWGHAIDLYGNRPVLLASAFLTALYPLMWTRVGAPLMLTLIFFSNVYSGGIYCAVDLTLQNLFMGQAKEQNRSMYFAVYFLFTQLIGMALGSTVGGLLLDNVFSHVDALGLALAGAPFTRYNALFALGGLLRLFVVLFLMVRLQEPGARKVEELLAGAKAASVHRMYMLRAVWLRKHLRRRYEKSRGNQENLEEDAEL
ncbi:MAG: MFS transporter [Eubacteriales bacterium]|nr:MFS transporter [Eubacteriales bacterium]